MCVVCLYVYVCILVCVCGGFTLADGIDRSARRLGENVNVSASRARAARAGHWRSSGRASDQGRVTFLPIISLYRVLPLHLIQYTYTVHHCIALTQITSFSKYQVFSKKKKYHLRKQNISSVLYFKNYKQILSQQYNIVTDVTVIFV